jgi:hypothetical protein
MGRCAERGRGLGAKPPGLAPYSCTRREEVTVHASEAAQTARPTPLRKLCSVLVSARCSQTRCATILDMSTLKIARYSLIQCSVWTP